jgi:hypothetical protein
MAQIDHIKSIILAKESALAAAMALRSYYTETYGYQIAQFEQDIYELNISLQLAEANVIDESELWGGEAFAEPVPVAEPVAVAAPVPVYPQRQPRTTLKWVSSTNPETYRVAVIKKDGLLEVKNIENGGALCHDAATCNCVPCSEFNLSSCLDTTPPWYRRPLAKTFYKTEASWRSTLPNNGTVTVS